MRPNTPDLQMRKLGGGGVARWYYYVRNNCRIAMDLEDCFQLLHCLLKRLWFVPLDIWIVREPGCVLNSLTFRACLGSTQECSHLSMSFCVCVVLPERTLANLTPQPV